MLELEDKKSVNQFFEPMFLMKNRNCARIVRCYYCFISKDSQLWIVMEYCPYTLTTYLELPRNRNNIDELKRIFLQCCEGVKYLHS
jgi:serine/threonine protein kinase